MRTAAGGEPEIGSSPASHISGVDGNTRAGGEELQRWVGSPYQRLEGMRVHPIFPRILVHLQCGRVQENLERG